MKNCTKITLAGTVMLMVPAVNADDADIQSVIESDDWETLKNIWKLINGVEPIDHLSDNPIAEEKGDSLRAVIDALFSEIEDPQLHTAVSLIQRITSTRIMRLSRINPYLITRMMPPWTETVQHDLLFNFEDRITTLMTLVESGEVSAAEFIAARDTLMERAETWAVLEILHEVQTYRHHDYFNWRSETIDTDAVLERLDLSYRAALDTLKKLEPGENTEYFRLAVRQHEEFLEKYSEFEQAKPVLRMLLADLIEAEI
ncbi:MAG: hypothetical protein KAR40_02535 [Candidatus Sabulitectum sp.]|nr:hypothetical protein [Candidatus Sabulitectum sp.]